MIVYLMALTLQLSKYRIKLATIMTVARVAKNQMCKSLRIEL